MKGLIQRVKHASVKIDGDIFSQINNGFLILLGVDKGDSEANADKLAEKVSKLRIFEDENDKMNLSLQDVNGEMLVISQFTLLADARKGRRPNFVKAARPEQAKMLYDHFVENVKAQGINVAEGIFQTHMLVRIHNDGPVTILLDSNKLF